MSKRDDAGVAPQAHAERYVSMRSGEPILVGCSCGLGRNHTREEFVAFRSAAARRDGAAAIGARLDEESGRGGAA